MINDIITYHNRGGEQLPSPNICYGKENVMVNKEEWREIPLSPNYKISNKGRVIGPYGTILKQNIETNGYYRISISKKVGQKNRYVHQLVMEVFVGERPDGYCVDHIDRDKLNNNAQNLRYITRRENALNIDRTNKHLAGAMKRKDGRWNKPWFSHISIKGKTVYVGSFKTEIEAHNKYMEKVYELR